MTTTKTEAADEDIAVRLRAWADSFFPPTIEDVLIAADEIEKLREELKNPVCDCPYLGDLIKKDDEIERLRSDEKKYQAIISKLIAKKVADEYWSKILDGDDFDPWAALKEGE